MPYVSAAARASAGVNRRSSSMEPDAAAARVVGCALRPMRDTDVGATKAEARVSDAAMQKPRMERRWLGGRVVWG